MTSASPDQGSTASTHVLVVDDDPSIRQMIADYLGDNEMKVAYTGKVAADSIEFSREMTGGQGGGRKTTFTAKKQ